MPESRRPSRRDPSASPLRVNFSAGQNWHIGANAQSLAVLGNGYPHIGGGLEMVKGSETLASENFQGAFGTGTDGQLSNAQDSKAYYGFDLHNEKIMLFRPETTNIAIWYKDGAASYQNKGFNMKGASTGKSLNDYSRDPLKWGTKNQTTEIQGWIVHGRPSVDPYMQCVEKVRSAFTSGTDGNKGKAEEYYDPGRILPMVEAGFYTDNTNPKISFHGVPVPIITGQHKELTFGAPFGKGLIVNGDSYGNGGQEHFRYYDSGWKNPYGVAAQADAGDGDASHDIFCVTQKSYGPTQRFFIAMENNLDATGPNMHMFVAGHANGDTDPYANDDSQKLFWAIKSQDGGLHQEYSTSTHYNGGQTNIDDTRDGSGSGTATVAANKIFWNCPHPVSVDFDESGNMYMAYWQADGDGSAGYANIARYQVILRKYTKNATTGAYTIARTHKIIGTEQTNVAAVGGVKLIYSPPDATHTSGCIYTIVQTNFGSGTSWVDSQLVVHQTSCGDTWTDAAGPPTTADKRNIRVADDKNIYWYSCDILKDSNRTGNNSLVITAMSDNSNDGAYIWHQDTASINTARTSVSDAENQMTKLTSIHGFEHPLHRGIPPLMKCFKHHGENKVGILAAVIADGKTQWFGWTGTYDDEKFVSFATDFSPSSALGHVYSDTTDEEITNYADRVVPSNMGNFNLPIYGYHGDLQGRFHYKYPFYNRWNVRREAVTGNDNSSYVGRVSYSFRGGFFDSWNPKYGQDDDGLNVQDFSNQAGCRHGALGDANGLIPTNLGAFTNVSGTNFDTWAAGLSGSVNGATCMFPTTWNGNCALMYPTYQQDLSSSVNHHGTTNARRLDFVIHGTIYGGSEDKGHPYLKDTTEGYGASSTNAYRPYPSNNLWCGSNLNPLTPIIKLPDGEDEEKWHPKTKTFKKPILAGLDINMLDRVTTTAGDIPPGTYRYKIAFAKSGANNKYKSTGAEGNIFNHNKLDAFFEIDTTEKHGLIGVKLHFNKPLLEGRTIMSAGGAATNATVDQYNIKGSMGDSGGTSNTLATRQVGKTVSANEDGWYTHFDYYGVADILTNPYLHPTTAGESLKRFWVAEDDNGNSSEVFVDFAGNKSDGDATSAANKGRHWNHGGFSHNSGAGTELHLTDSSGTELSFSSWISLSDDAHFARILKQGDALGMGGGLIHYGPEQDKTKPYIRYIIIYRTGDVSKASTDPEAYHKVGEIDLVDDVDWDTVSEPITFLDTVPPRYMSSVEGNYINGMMPVDGDNITAMAASGNRLWVAYNDTFTSTADKYKVPSTLMYSGTHWEYMSPLNSVVVDDNAVIHSLKDYDGSLWIFTDRGSYVVPDSHSSPTDSNFRIVKRSDFIIHRHPNDSERFLRLDGVMFILGEDGLHMYDPHPANPKKFVNLSEPVEDFFKFHRETAMGLYYDTDTKSIICYLKSVTDAPKERFVSKIEATTNQSQRICTVNYHIPTRSWWSHVDELTDHTENDDMVNPWERVDDVISVVPDSNPATAANAYSTRASGKYSFDPINIMLRDAVSASSKKVVEVSRFGHVYGKFETAGGDVERAEHDMLIQTGWIGNPGEERYWDVLEIDYVPPVLSKDTHMSFDINIDTLNPHAKATGDSLTDNTAGNGTPVTLNVELNDEVNTKEVTTNTYDNVAQGIPMRVQVPIKAQGEMIRLRMRTKLRNNDSDIEDNGYISTDCSPPRVVEVQFRTRFVGRDRKK